MTLPSSVQVATTLIRRLTHGDDGVAIDASAKSRLRRAMADALTAYAAQQVKHAVKDGDCYYCHQQTDKFSGNPGKWPLSFSHADAPGVVRPHHTQCVQERLESAA